MTVSDSASAPAAGPRGQRARAPTTFEAIVVGAGPVGLVAALALQRAGWRTALVERGHLPPRWQAAQVDPRVYAIAPASAELLASLDLWDAIAAARACAYTAMQVWEREPARALVFEAADAARDELGWIVEHGLIADVAARALAGVAVFEQAAIAALELPDDDGGTAALELADGRRLTARLIVAADGADSQLRELAGIASQGRRYPQDALVCHVETSEPHRAVARQRFLASGPLAALPLSDGRASIVWSAETALAAELQALDDDAFCARLGAAFQGRIGAVCASTARLRLPLRIAQAETYVRGGFALIGDAAHAIHPLAGQGVNLGFADVAELLATIGAARDAGRDWASARTLARYARSRRAANGEMLALTDLLQRGFSARLPGLRTALGLGLEAVGRIAPLRARLVRAAI